MNGRILFITHQLSRTGAPIVLLDMIKLCKRERADIDVITMMDGELGEQLHNMGIDYKISNFFSVAIAICFAFVVNKLYVFQSKSKTFGDTVQEFIKFVLGRLVTMVVEVGGVPFCVELLGQPKMVAKIETQVIVVIVNYFISKLFVFKSGSEQDK